MLSLGSEWTAVTEDGPGSRGDILREEELQQTAWLTRYGVFANSERNIIIIFHRYMNTVTRTALTQTHMYTRVLPLSTAAVVALFLILTPFSQLIKRVNNK